MRGNHVHDDGTGRCRTLYKCSACGVFEVSSGPTLDGTFVGSWRAHKIVAEVLSSPCAEQDRIIQVACGADPVLLSRVLRIISSIEGANKGIASESVSRREGLDSRQLSSFFPHGTGSLLITRKVEFSATRKTWLGHWRDDPASRVLIHILSRKRESFDGVISGFQACNNSSLEQLVAHGMTRKGRAFVAFNLVNGVPIHEYLEIFTTSSFQRAELFDRIRAAVIQANHAGLHHENLTRNSIMISEIDGKPFPTLVGLGLRSLSFDSGLMQPGGDQLALERILEDLEGDFGQSGLPVLGFMMSGSVFRSRRAEACWTSQVPLACSSHLALKALLVALLLVTLFLSTLLGGSDVVFMPATDGAAPEGSVILQGWQDRLRPEFISVDGEDFGSGFDVGQIDFTGDDFVQEQENLSSRMILERKTTSLVGGQLGVR